MDGKLAPPTAGTEARPVTPDGVRFTNWLNRHPVAKWTSPVWMLAGFAIVNEILKAAF